VHAEKPWIERVRSGALGAVVDVREQFAGAKHTTASADAHAFERGGWTFLRVAPNAVPKLPDVEGLYVARVFLDPSGRLMLAPGGVTVKLRPDLPIGEAKSFLEQAEVEVVRELRFGRNLFEVRAPRAVDAFDLSEKLSASSDVEYAEPKLLEHIERREAGGRG
jgi:hypothetical protein